jgi:hypothetical protein
VSEQTPTRLVRVPERDSSQLAERIALFSLVMNARQPPGLLDGLAELTRSEAQALLQEAKEWPSSKRQARVSLEFGARPDQHERLTAVVAEASPALRRALYAHMSPQQQQRFPHLASGAACPPGMGSLAARLVREATR